MPEGTGGTTCLWSRGRTDHGLELAQRNGVQIATLHNNQTQYTGRRHQLVIAKI